MRALLRKLFRRLNLFKRKFQNRYNRCLFEHVESLYLDNVVLGTNCSFHAPVRVVEGRGKLSIGKNNGFGYYCSPKFGDGALVIQPRKPDAEIVIGNNNWLNNNVSIIANEKIVIGDECRIGNNVVIVDCDFHEIEPAFRGRSHGITSTVSIGNNVWLGSNVMVLKGVTIGDNSVIGAMSLVSKSIPPNSLAVGNPARVLRRL